MRAIIISLLALAAFAGCKKSEICETGCYTQPPRFYFILADKQGKSLFTSTTDGIAVSYQANGQTVAAPQLNYPQKVLAATATPSTDFIVEDDFLANSSKNLNIRTFYLTYQGKTDTLGLDIHKVTATPDNGGNSTPVVTFDGRPMQSVDGSSINAPDYFVLKRR